MSCPGAKGLEILQSALKCPYTAIWFELKIFDFEANKCLVLKGILP